MRKSKGFHKLLVAGGVAILCGALAICGFLYVSQNKVSDELNEWQEKNADAIQKVVDSVKGSFHEVSGGARVYDSDDHLLFVVKQGVSTVVGDEFPEYAQQYLLNQLVESTPVRKLEHSDWVNAHSVLGKLRKKPSVESCLQKSVGYAALKVYCQINQAKVSPEAEFLLSMVLENELTQQQLLAYCAAMSSFNGIQGLAEASDVMFGMTVSQLNEQQLDYLLYSMGKEQVTWDDYRAHRTSQELPESSSLFGLTTSGPTEHAVLKARVKKELEHLLGDRLLSENFDVSLYYDSDLSNKLQTEMDTAFAGSISLQADGQTTLDGVLEVVSPKTAGVISFVEGRSINSKSREFVLPVQSTLGNYVAVKEFLRDNPDLTYTSYIEYEDETEATSFISVEEAVDTNQLDILGVTPVCESSVTIDEIANFVTGLYTEREPHFISQITFQGSSEKVYVDKGASPTAGEALNTNIRGMFVDNLQDIVGTYQEEYSNGLAFANITDQYIITGVLGSDALGYAMTYEDIDLLKNVSATVSSVMADMNVVPPLSVDSTGVLTAKLEQVRAENLNLIIGLVDEWVELLKTMPITSVSTRKAFEAELTRDITELQRCQRVLGAEVVEAQSDRLREVRVERTSELMKYVA